MSNSPRLASARHGWGKDDSHANILHVDMDCFFASVELLDHPELVGKPLIVGGHSNRGVVTSATYEARAYGVHAGMPVSRAVRLCPRAVVLPTRKGVYSQVSAEVMKILSSYTPAFQKVSVDEAYLDVSGVRNIFGSSTQIAIALRRRIKTELGIAASVGIAPSKLVAKIASSHAKPDGILLVPDTAVSAFLHDLPVGALPGVGKRVQEILLRSGVRTIGQLAQVPESDLQRKVGKAAGARLAQISLGIDASKVGESGPEKSIGTEVTFEQNVTAFPRLEEVLLAQAHECAAKLRAAKWQGQTIVVKLRGADFRTVTRSKTVPATDLGADIYKVARTLAHSVPLPTGGYRLVGLRVEGLVSAEVGIQLTIDGQDTRRAAESAMDGIAARFGASALRPASLLGDRKERNELGK
ncbi:DNA polymerase IV [Winkia sp. UMB0889B]|uniref:DNA polymerase IV n=1 Tax=Winkia sp. UMB0889B TaxID=3046315 RepID=UPI002553B917|nr:DNA polymerase IV [Winkia sp. UMB0889B]MDK7905140.1 DNA polymerase IV [Winkia sp. UMB0889B]